MNGIGGSPGRSRGWLSAAAVVLAWLTLCPFHAAEAVTVRLTDADPSSTVTVHVGDRIRLELHAAPSTGFRWNLRKLDASHLDQMGKGIRPDSDRLDTAGTQVFVWKAISAGNAIIALEYSRPNDDRTIPPEKRVELRVAVTAGELASAKPGGDTSLAPALQLLSAYAGRLPCGDCLEVKENLSLYAQDTENPTTGVFVDIRRYQGAPGGDKTIAGTGRYAVVHGTYADPSLTVYVLGSPGGGTENYKFEPDRLVPLDPQGLPVDQPPGRDSSLLRVKASDDF